MESTLLTPNDKEKISYVNALSATLRFVRWLPSSQPVELVVWGRPPELPLRRHTTNYLHNLQTCSHPPTQVLPHRQNDNILEVHCRTVLWCKVHTSNKTPNHKAVSWHLHFGVRVGYVVFLPGQPRNHSRRHIYCPPIFNTRLAAQRGGHLRRCAGRRGVVNSIPTNCTGFRDTFITCSK